MKKFLTVLLVIAVMFTFSFGTAFAYNDTDIVADRSAALTKITDKYDESLSTISYQLAVVKATASASRNPSGASDADWNAACDAAFDEVKAALDVKLAEAYQLLGDEELRASATSTGILGYEFATTGTGSDGYVLIADAIKKVNIGATNLSVTCWDDSADKFKVAEIDANEATYDATLAKAIAAIKAYDLDQFSKDDKVTHNGVTKSSYEWAVAKQADALAYLGALKGYGEEVTIGGSTFNCATTHVTAIYLIQNAGTVGEAGTGRFFTGAAVTGVTTTLPAMTALKTTATLTTDTAKIEYAKAKAIAAVKTAIEGQRAKELDTQNQIIFTQSVATKPNQSAIDAANKEIKKINEKYDAMVKVWEYRLTNAEYKVEKAGSNEMINAYYNGALYNDKINSSTDAIGFFNGNTYNAYGIYAGGVDFTTELVTPLVTAAKAVEIIELVADLEDEAAALKATIAVDGSTYIDVDEALKEAIDQAYMTGAATLDRTFSDTAVHMNAHKLLGDNCAGTPSAEKVTLNGKEYDNIGQWATTGYSTNNTKTVKAIIKDAKAAVKAAATVEDANAAFLDAYAKYDAVLTIADQADLFAYNGALYGKDTAAKAELEAYINYKVSLMADAPAADTAARLKTYFQTATPVSSIALPSYMEEVVDAASMQAAIDAVKTAVDSLKTKAELKAEGSALVKEVNAVKRAVTLEQKDEVLALYDKLVDYADYCTMTGYSNPTTAAKALVESDIAGLENLELAQLAAAKKELGAVADLTLASEEAVAAFEKAQDAYNDLYAPGSDYAAAAGNPAKYTDANDYVAKIFELKVKAAEALVKALPVNATAAQVKAASDAVEALGFAGICKINTRGNADLLTKLNKFEQDAETNSISAVESLKIKATTKAYKGYIKLTWKVTGDASAADGFQIYRSTNYKTGGKLYYTTKKATTRSFKNSSVKKGTKYYYKVRAYKVVDGVTYYSDWSTRGIRVAK